MSAFTYALIGLAIAGVLLAVVLGGYTVATYNRLVTLRQRLANAGSQIDVQLQRRHDLIPNLVQTVKGYMSHERETLEAVVAARDDAKRVVGRADWRQASDVRQAAAAESVLTSTVGRLVARVEAYPELKSDKHAAQLFEELASTENRVAFARQAFNDAVTSYNTKRQTFPPSLIAGMFGFREAALFEVDTPAAYKPVTVSFAEPVGGR